MQQIELEVNSVVAAVIFIGAIVFDATSAHDPQPLHNVPLSMRCSCIILIACLASPPIRQSAVFLQRLVLAIALGVISMVGSHIGSKGSRFADLIFTFLIGTMTLSSYMRGGTESLSKSKKRQLTPDAPAFTRRDSVSALAISILFYSSLRVIRQCIVYSGAVRDFSISTTDWTGNNTNLVPGYALMSVASLCAVGFGGTVSFALSASLLASSSLREIGTGAKREIMLVAGFLQFSAAFWATVALSDQQDELNVIFDAAACNSVACPASGTARRFAMMNGQSSAIWMNTLGTFVLAYTPQSTAEPLISPVVVVWGLLSTVACIAVIFAYSSFSGPGIYVEISTLISLAGVTIGAFVNAELGSIVFAVGLGYDEFVSASQNSLLTLLTYFTHCSIFVGTMCLILRTVVVLVVEFTWEFIGSKATDILDDVVGVLTVAGMSIFSFLYLATLSLISTYEGDLMGPDSYEPGPQRYARSMIAAVLEHWLPILIFLPLYRSKHVKTIDFGWKLAVWVGSLILSATIWMIALSVAEKEASDLYRLEAQYPFMASIVVTTIVPWILLSLI